VDKIDASADSAEGGNLERVVGTYLSEKARRALGEIGLSKSEIKAYVALVSSGSLSAADISRLSGLPHKKIYEVLAGLEKKGWIESDRSRPTKFYPKSPATALETSKMDAENRLIQNQADVLNELLPIFEKRAESERPEIWIVRGEATILSKVKETVLGCERELMLAIPVVASRFTGLIAPFLATLHEKGVKIKVMTDESTSQDSLGATGRWAEVRARQLQFGGGVIADARNVVLLLGEEPGGSGLAIWADHVGLAKLAKDYFEYLWNESKPFPQR